MERNGDEAATAPPRRAGRREWVGLAVLALPCVLYSMDLTVLYLAVPSLTEDLQPSATGLLWITDVYGFLLAGCLITMGRLGDRIGRRRLLLAGAAAFGGVSVLAALSTTVPMLIAARALLGVAAASLAPSTLSLISNMFADPRQRAFAIGVWVASFSAGAAAGPLLGGIVLTWFRWGAVFLLAVPFMALLLALGPRLLPEFRDPSAERLDVPSAALSLATVLSAVYGVKRLAADGAEPWAFAALAAAAALGAAFALRQRRLDDPLVDLALFRVRAFRAALAANVVSVGVIFGVELFITQYLQITRGLSPLAAAGWTVPSALGLAAGSLAAPLIVRRVPQGSAMAGGLVVVAGGLALVAAAGTGGALGVVVTGWVVFSLGAGLPVALATDIIVGSVPPARAGVASGVSETSTELGGALGIAILGSVGAAASGGAFVDGMRAAAVAGAALALVAAAGVGAGLRSD